MSLKAVVFDMDGLLLDSERIALKMFLQVCEGLGVTPNREAYLSCIGSNAARTRQLLMDGHSPEFPFEKVMNLWEEAYQKEAFEKPVPLKTGVVSLLTFLTEAGIPLAVATSTAFDKACIKLGKAGLIDYFRVIVAGDQVKQSKPEPEIYQKAARELKLETAHCLALEDSDNGVKAAHAAGMEVFQIPDLVAPGKSVKALGHPVLSSLLEVQEELEKRLKQEI